MKKILISLGVIMAVAATAFGSIKVTSSLLGDTETASNNQIAAGAIDLKIDNTSYYNGELNPGTTWLAPADLDNGQLFFDFHDLKPGDWGEDTISLHVGSNEAWSCLDITLTKNDDISSTEPELKSPNETANDPNNVWDGELAPEITLIWWKDDGDNVLENDEPLLHQGLLSEMLTLSDKKLSLALADSTANPFEPAGPLQGDKTYYLAKAWCFGEMTLTPLTQDGAGNLTNPTIAQGFTCEDISGFNNITQTDAVIGDLKFSAVQARHNPHFRCIPETGPKIDLELTKSANPTTLLKGENTTFTVTATNLGPDPATGVVVTDLLPTGASYVSDDSAGSYVSGVWTIGNIAVAETKTLNIVATITVSGQVTNIAEVTVANEPDINITNNQDDASVAAGLQIDLSLQKSFNPTSVSVNANTILTLTVANAGPHDAHNVTVTDVLPAGLSYVSQSGNGTYDQNTGIWTVGTVTTGGSTTINLTVKVGTQGTHQNTAEVKTADEPDKDSTPNNGVATEDDQASASVYGEQTDLELDKTVNIHTAKQGESVVFTVTLTNKGPSTATNVQIKDNHPSGLPYVSHDVSGNGSYDPVTGIFTINSLAANHFARVDIYVDSNVTPNTYTNYAQVMAAGQHDPDSTPNNYPPFDEDDNASDSVTITL